MPTFTVVPACDHIPEIRVLFLEYVSWMGLNLDFQNFDRELATLPGEYAPPDGSLYICLADNAVAAGCIGLRRFDDSRGEIKRLYVRDAFRGNGLGRMLTSKVIEDAESIGYSALLLDTLADRMRHAERMYREMGFYETEPYRFNPEPDVVYLEKKMHIFKY